MISMVQSGSFKKTAKAAVNPSVGLSFAGLAETVIEAAAVDSLFG